MAMNASVLSSKSSLHATFLSHYYAARAAGRVPGFAWADRFAHWALRIPLIALLLYYGLQKFPDVFVAPGAYGVPAVLFILAAFAEILGPIALFLGGIVETWRPKVGWIRLTGDALTRAGGFAGVAAVGGVIAFFYWGALSITDPHVMQLGLALFLLFRGNRDSRWMS
ncbi:MAG: hypothetical protein AAF376_13025 [Pseudomonadota bacterium]